MEKKNEGCFDKDASFVGKTMPVGTTGAGDGWRSVFETCTRNGLEIPCWYQFVLVTAYCVPY